MRLNGLVPAKCEPGEPDIFYAVFDTLITHDYNTGQTFISGDHENIDALAAELSSIKTTPQTRPRAPHPSIIQGVSEQEYIDAVETIIEEIRAGNTYQTNFTMPIAADVSGQDAADIFLRLRAEHPAPFAAFIDRGDSTVVSASPERFIRIREDQIDTSPIKGTRKRSPDPVEDARLRAELLASEKDRAENTMIVDLLRNDIGRVCEFGSVRVEKLCDLEEHPSLFHLVSTVRGSLRKDAGIAEILPAVFPCGSITGAPKISTIKIIDKLERAPRGLSMGAVGVNINGNAFAVSPCFDTSVAIRTMVIRDGIAKFNVGGGITIDSDPHAEYEEALLKAKALIAAIDQY
jgi:para-aminobenzoate synthetase component 1